jgi:lysozyme family protein
MVAKNLSFALGEILKHEGGYVDHPRDPGGATNMGVTRRTLASWRGVKPYGKLAKSEVRALEMREVRAIYKARYWDRVAGNKLPSGLDLALFDFAVNSGVSRAAKSLQALLKVRRDGIIGVITLRALKRKVGRVGVAVIIKNICEGRLAFLRRLRIFSTFGRGWQKRVASVLRVSLAMVEEKREIDPKEIIEEKKENEMNILSGYKTYIIGAFMIVAALAQFLGVDLPHLDGQSATQLLMEALAFVFLRRGLKSEVGSV